MIKKFTIIILLFCAIISCGKKGDPKYVDPDKKAEIKKQTDTIEDQIDIAIKKIKTEKDAIIDEKNEYINELESSYFHCCC